MKTKKSPAPLGSVSSGTLRPEDLIPAFLDVLRSIRPLRRADRKLVRELDAITAEYDTAAFKDGSTDYYLEELFTALDSYAPPYFYFGSHPGDGSDFGFYLSENFDEDFNDVSEIGTDIVESVYNLRVSDLAEVPRGFSGEVLLVNERGNATLYAYSRGRRREVWSVV